MIDDRVFEDENPFQSSRYPTPDELKDLERTLGKLDDVQTLGDWDAEFVDDMCRRVIKYGKRTVVTARQWNQIERLKKEHL